MELVLIPQGRFKMGSPEPERKSVFESIYEKEVPEWLNAEGPQHEVEIGRPFYLGKTVVTQKQFRLVMGYNPSYFSRDGKKQQGEAYRAEPAGGKEKVERKKDSELDKFPVENVSWDEAKAFCERLSGMPEEKRLGRVYRLPTEAEWERACRGGSSADHPFSVGDSLSSAQANFKGDEPYGETPKGTFLGRTCEVGSYEANPLGLHDMHGNVFVWCGLVRGGLLQGQPLARPGGAGPGHRRVVRGGCWGTNGRSCRTARRNWLAAGEPERERGFPRSLGAS